MKLRLLVFALLGLISIAAIAAEAPWYKWVNTVDRTTLCAQLPPGDAWVRVQGPFKDALCRTPGVPN